MYLLIPKGEKYITCKRDVGFVRIFSSPILFVSPPTTTTIAAAHTKTSEAGSWFQFQRSKCVAQRKTKHYTTMLILSHIYSLSLSLWSFCRATHGTFTHRRHCHRILSRSVKGIPGDSHKIYNASFFRFDCSSFAFHNRKYFMPWSHADQVVWYDWSLELKYNQFRSKF